MSFKDLMDEEELLIDKISVKRRKTREDLKIYEEIFDQRTLFTLYELIRKGYISEIGGVVNSGKEAVIINGRLKSEEIAIKVYRTLTTPFRDRRLYIVGDRRFRKMRRNIRQMVMLWALKEYKNLKRMYENGVSVPKPVYCQNNVLIMSFIGEDGIPAPLLKDAEMNSPHEVFQQVIDDIYRMYCGARLVHGDLSEYNILLWDRPVIIDVSQAVLSSHPYAQEFLLKDIRNVLRFFSKRGVDVPQEEKIFKDILREAGEI